MKKLIGIFCFVFHLGLVAQDCELPNAISNSTGVNMTVLLNSSFLNTISVDSDLPYIVAQVDGGLVVGAAYIAPDSLDNQSQSIAIWGDDTVTPEIDGATEGQQILLYLVDSLDYSSISSLGVLNIANNEVSSDLVYSANGIYVVQSGVKNFECTGIIVGCTDANACNYSQEAMQDDGSCEYPEMYYDCNGLCINDSNENYVCDELEGCTDSLACNYSMNAVFDDESCEYLQVILTYDASSNTINSFIQDGEAEPNFYNWYLNGVLIQGEENAIYSPVENGVYTLATAVDVVNPDIDDWCAGESTIEITGLSLMEERFGFKVYPNPVKDFLTIEWNQGRLDQVEVYSALGVKVFESTIASTQEKFAVRTEDWADGLYFVSLKYSDKVETRVIQILH